MTYFRTDPEALKPMTDAALLEQVLKEVRKVAGDALMDTMVSDALAELRGRLISREMLRGDEGDGAIRFGDRVSFTHHYRRFIGRRQVWPRGEKSRYPHPVQWSIEVRDRHPDSTVEDRPSLETVTWQRVPNQLLTARTERPDFTGIFGGEVRKAEGWVGRWADEYVGHGWRLHAYLPLAEVMVKSAGRPLMFVVHLNDLELAL